MPAARSLKKPGSDQDILSNRRGEKVKRSIEWLIKRLIKVGAKVAYQGRMWQVHAASAFPLAGHYRAVFG